VVENQTRARSSVPAEQGRGNGARHLLRLADQHKERQTRHSHWDTAGSRYFEEGSRGAVREDRPPGPQRSLFSFPGTQS
jgi:hypothetical protein